MREHESNLFITILNSERELNWFSFCRKTMTDKQLDNNIDSDFVKLILILKKVYYINIYNEQEEKE